MKANRTYFLYARKSTDVEDKQVLSIDAQLSELRQFAEREQLPIAQMFIEKQSAKAPGRPLFNEMMQRIEKGEASGIVAWHPDRLARNGVDGGQITFALDNGTLQSLKFPSFWFESTPQGKFMLNMAFSQSQYYVDALSENTKRGLREKVRRGEYPSQAPMGYLNDVRTKRVIIDPERAPVVKEIFERYATGSETTETIRRFLGDKNIRTGNGKLLCRATVVYMLTNPFYYGHFRYTGELHEGRHEPIISKSLYDQVQDVMQKRWRRKGVKSDPKPLTGLLRCGECGSAITAEIQKGHTYYRCTKKNRISKCSQPYIREEALDAEVSGLVARFALRSDWADEMLLMLEAEKKGRDQANNTVLASKRAEIDALGAKLQRITDAFLDAVIDRSTYLAEKAKVMSQKKTLEEQTQVLAAGQNTWLEPFKNWLKTAKNAGKIAKTGSLLEKKALAQKIFGSNLVLDNKKARADAVKPWSLLLENHLCGGMVHRAGLEPATF